MPIEPIEYEMMRTTFEVVAGAALTLLGTSVALGLGWLRAHRRARRAERALEAIQRTNEFGTADALDGPLPSARQVSVGLDALAIEVERLAEVQRYQSGLLERLAGASPSGALPRDAKSITPH